MLSQVAQLANLHAAFGRVAEARGGAGVDRLTIGAFRKNLDLNLASLASELTSATYQPLPLLRFLVAKPNGSPRALVIPAVRDRVAQAAALNILEPIFEARFKEVSFAYRKGRSVKHAALRVKALRDKGYRYLLDADLDDFFHQIDHERLFARLSQIVPDPGLLRLLRLWVRAEVYDGRQVYIMEKGLPQGAVISPLLSNLFLDEFDEALLARGFQLVRYADDFLVLTKTRAEAEAALQASQEILTRLRLSLDPEDTQITHFDEGFKYLGLIFFKDAILAPFDRAPKKNQILYMPPPFDLKAYLARKKSPSLR